ncbi:MAG: hypothetical protein MUC62_05810 [Candidatus Thermoplasmatota archaeon]|nr:hypothetical protein [Candidatus Thermoplasmatota archaeon]
MRKTLPLLALGVVGVLTIVAISMSMAATYNSKTVDLIAGKTMDAGEVIVTNDGSNIYVKFTAGEDWYITETHVHVADDVSKLPSAGKTKNLVPGQFDYKGEHDYLTEYTYKIPLGSWGNGKTLYVAAHAVVGHLYDCGDDDCDGCVVNLEAFEVSLPDTATIKLVYPYSGAPSYFPKITVTDGDGLDGDHEGWCVDIGRTINQNTQYNAKVYNSYETLPSGLVDYPENLDMVNWLLNQDFVGKTSPGGYGTYTYGDVQRAIWTLIDISQSTASIGTYSAERVSELVDLAEDEDGFEPGCCEKIGVIFAPVDSDGKVTNQVVLVMVDVPCYGEETAWGKGTRYNNKGNWAMYFDYKVIIAD